MRPAIPWLDSSGAYIEGALLPDVVHSLTSPGNQWENALEHVRFGYRVPDELREKAIEYLRRLGNYTRTDLSDMPADEISARVLWDACGCIKENDFWEGLEG